MCEHLHHNIFIKNDHEFSNGKWHFLPANNSMNIIDNLH